MAAVRISHSHGVERIGDIHGAERDSMTRPLGKRRTGFFLTAPAADRGFAGAQFILGHEGILSSSIQMYTTIELSSAGRLGARSTIPSTDFLVFPTSLNFGLNTLYIVVRCDDSYNIKCCEAEVYTIRT